MQSLVFRALDSQFVLSCRNQIGRLRLFAGLFEDELRNEAFFTTSSLGRWQASAQLLEFSLDPLRMFVRDRIGALEELSRSSYETAVSFLKREIRSARAVLEGKNDIGKLHADQEGPQLSGGRNEERIERFFSALTHVLRVRYGLTLWGEALSQTLERETTACPGLETLPHLDADDLGPLRSVAIATRQDLFVALKTENPEDLFGASQRAFLALYFIAVVQPANFTHQLHTSMVTLHAEALRVMPPGLLNSLMHGRYHVLQILTPKMFSGQAISLRACPIS